MRISTHSQALSHPPPPKHSDGGRGGSRSSSSSSSSRSRSSSLRAEAQRFSLDGGGVVASGGAAGVPFEWLLRPIGSVERPATEDRFMDLKRFVVACAYRAGSPPFPVKSTLPPVLLSFHAATLYAAGSLLVAPPSAAHVAGGAGMYALLTFGITGGHHRYFSHRSYRTSRPFQFAIALLGSLAWQRGPIWWSSHHNHHHLHSDTGRDPHSPVTGSWLWSHMGWYWASAEHDPPLDKFARTWRSFPELAALDKLHFAPGLLLAASLYACGGGGALLWGFVVPVTCCWNSIFAIGSLCHGDLGGGTRRFETGGADTSTNVWWVAMLTLGDGWRPPPPFFCPPVALPSPSLPPPPPHSPGTTTTTPSGGARGRGWPRTSSTPPTPRCARSRRSASCGISRCRPRNRSPRPRGCERQGSVLKGGGGES